MKILNRKPWAYYNDFDADAVDWLRSLIKGGLIPDGDVDPRSILEVTASELRRLAEVAGLDAASLKSARNYRVSALRGYGNAINPYAAAIFIQSFCESLDALGDDLDDLL